jgi:hypothetical protein
MVASNTNDPSRSAEMLRDSLFSRLLRAISCSDGSASDVEMLSAG